MVKRTTIRLDDQLLKDAKRLALETGRTLTAVMEEALRAALAHSTKKTRRRRVNLPVDRSGGRLMPGVNLDHNASVRDIMDGFDAPP